jgi:hypothetical protein
MKRDVMKIRSGYPVSTQDVGRSREKDVAKVLLGMFFRRL